MGVVRKCECDRDTCFTCRRRRLYNDSRSRWIPGTRQVAFRKPKESVWLGGRADVDDSVLDQEAQRWLQERC